MKRFWLGKILSPGAMLTLINSILHTLPLYYMSLIDPSLSILSSIAKLMFNFFWHDKKGNKKYHWIIWEKICRPKEEGGFGMRRFNDIEKTFGYKCSGDLDNQLPLGHVS